MLRNFILAFFIIHNDNKLARFDTFNSAFYGVEHQCILCKVNQNFVKPIFTENACLYYLLMHL